MGRSACIAPCSTPTSLWPLRGIRSRWRLFTRVTLRKAQAKGTMTSGFERSRTLPRLEKLRQAPPIRLPCSACGLQRLLGKLQSHWRRWKRLQQCARLAKTAPRALHRKEVQDPLIQRKRLQHLTSWRSYTLEKTAESGYDLR